MERVEKLERGAGDDKHLYTLVYGGWPRESARKDILSNLDETLRKLELRALTDTAAFTTGPRKSMALQSFKVREGETFASMRSRMASIVSAIATTEVRVGPGGKRMFATFSKLRELRERGDHSAWIRRTIRSLNADQESALEVEYNTGGAWLHGRKIASAVDAPGSTG